MQSKENTLHLIVVVLCRYQDGIKPTKVFIRNACVRKKNGEKAGKTSDFHANLTLSEGERAAG